MAPAAVSPAPEGRLGFWSAERAAFSSSSLSYRLLLLLEDRRVVDDGVICLLRVEVGVKDDAFWRERIIAVNFIVFILLRWMCCCLCVEISDYEKVKVKVKVEIFVLGGVSFSLQRA